MNRDETMNVDATTGGAKAGKLAQPHLAPHDALLEYFEHLGKGELKYPSDANGVPNYSKGFKYSLSYNAMQRHALLWWGGEEFDPETGTHHLIAVAWHALALRHFTINGKGTDDRWERAPVNVHDTALEAVRNTRLMADDRLNRLLHRNYEHDGLPTALAENTEASHRGDKPIWVTE